jgi:pyruvate/2-oxoglutarate dehydrogenase complex dihydrolipoamide acyltransferase (E2) component
MGNTGGLIAEWYVHEGARVAAGDAVFRLESDFVSLDIEAESAGVVRHVVPAGIPQFEGGVVGYVLARGERMPALEGMDDWDEPGDPAAFDQDPAAAAFTGGVGHDFLAGPAARDAAAPVLLRPRSKAGDEDEKPGLWEQVTDEKEEPAVSRAFAMQRLVLRVALPMNEVASVREQLALEWADEAVPVTDETMVVRAVGRALEDRESLGRFKDVVDLVVLGTGGPARFAAPRPGKGSFHDVARALQQPRGEAASPVAVVSFTAFAVDSAEPRLEPGQAMVIAVARPVVTTAATLTLVCDPDQVEDHDAAAFLGRVRTLLVQPYALLAE